MAHLVGTETWNWEPTRTQVYRDTHSEEGVRLPLRERSFISFMYGGRWIEDFNLIAVAQSNALQRNAYGPFEDTTTTYETVDGQFYWGTHFTNNALDLALAGDALTENELQDFINWFQPGVLRELVLAEHPNRGIWARVAAQPTFSFLPWEDKKDVYVGGVLMTTSTTRYSGQVTLSFIMDEPFWHSRVNYFNIFYDKNAKDKIVETVPWPLGTEIPSNMVAITEDPDFAKIILEDGLPSFIVYDLLARTDEAYVNLSYVASEEDEENEKQNDFIIGSSGVITPDTVLNSDNPLYLYYCGTAPGTPTISFTYTPQITLDYITYPLNMYSEKELGSSAKKVNYIRVGKTSLLFTLPALLMGYNQAIDIVKNFKVGESAQEARITLRDNVFEYYSRSWAIYCIDAMIALQEGTTSAGALTSDFQSKFIKRMKYFLSPNGDNTLYPVQVSINCKDGTVQSTFKCRCASADTSMSAPSMVTFQDVEQSTEDMIRSQFLKLDERNTPDDQGMVTKERCSKVTTDYPASAGSLTNFTVTYQYLYY